MADLRPITLHEGNDETLLLTITPEDPAESLLPVTSLELYLKADPCVADTAPGVLKLTTANPAQMTITAHTAAQIIALAFIPAAALAAPYRRFWHVDGLVGVLRRSAMYGPVTVVDL